MEECQGTLLHPWACSKGVYSGAVLYSIPLPTLPPPAKSLKFYLKVTQILDQERLNSVTYIDYANKSDLHILSMVITMLSLLLRAAENLKTEFCRNKYGNSQALCVVDSKNHAKMSNVTY